VHVVPDARLDAGRGLAPIFQAAKDLKLTEVVLVHGISHNPTVGLSVCFSLCDSRQPRLHCRIFVDKCCINRPNGFFAQPCSTKTVFTTPFSHDPLPAASSGGFVAPAL
jgi:hypothetical protein